MRTRGDGWPCAGGSLLLLLMWAGCSGAHQIVTPPDAVELPVVIFSVANADRSAIAADIEITVNGQPSIYGSFAPSPAGKYLYFSSRIPGKRMAIRAVSRSGGDTVEAERNVIVEDRAWVVVTRLNRDGVSEIEIAVSYESPAVKDRQAE